MGIVDQVGSGVTLLKKGDRVVMPFNVADGRCLNCEEGNTAYCTGVNPGFAGGAYGYVAMVCLSGVILSMRAVFSLPRCFWTPAHIFLRLQGFRLMQCGPRMRSANSAMSFRVHTLVAK